MTAPMTSRALLVTAVDRVGLTGFDVPQPAPGQLLVRAAYTGISPGTELRGMAGKQVGGKAFPFVPGYQCAGRVVAAGEGVTMMPGTAVFCTGSTHTGPHNRQWGGHVELALVAAERAVVLGGAVDLVEASILKLAAIALRGLRLADPKPGQCVAVVGLGALGQICARLYQAMGCRVVGMDLNPARVALASRAGATSLVVQGSLGETLRGEMPEGADIVVDVTGSPRVLEQSVALVRDLPWADDRGAGGKLVIQGSYASAPVFDFATAFSREATILVPRDHRWVDLADAAQMLAAGKLGLRDIVTAVRSPRDAQEVYDQLRDPQSDALTFCFDWSGPEA